MCGAARCGKARRMDEGIAQRVLAHRLDEYLQATRFAVGNNVDACALHVADGEQRGVILRLLQQIARDAPDLGRPDARHLGAELFPVYEPVGLRIAADDGGFEWHERGRINLPTGATFCAPRWRA